MRESASTQYVVEGAVAVVFFRTGFADRDAQAFAAADLGRLFSIVLFATDNVNAVVVNVGAVLVGSFDVDAAAGAVIARD